MNPVFATSLPLPQTALFYVLVVAFWWPAWRLLQAFCGHAAAPWWERATFALAYAFGGFSLVSGPLLLLHASTDTARIVLGLAWLTACLSAEVLVRKTSTAAPKHANRAEPAPEIEAHALIPWAFLPTFAAAALLPFEILPRGIGLGLLAATAVANLIQVLRRMRSSSMEDGMLEVGAPSVDRFPQALFLILLAVALVSPVFHHRADADDNLYLSEALLLQDSEAMGLHAPTHRGEALPSNPVYAWQSFELWAAQTARLSGLHPLITLRSLAGPLLLLAVLAMHAALLRRLLPQRLLPYAMVMVLAYFLFGMSSQWTPNNYLLTRPAQGKTWLMHFGTLVLLLQGSRFLRAPDAARGLALALLCFACLGWAPTSILLVPALLGTLALGHWLQQRNRAALIHGALAVACALPQFLFALFLATRDDRLVQEEVLGEGGLGTWHDLFLFTFLKHNTGGGVLELLILASTPLLLLALPQTRRHVFPMVFVGSAFLLVLNPLLYPFLGEATAGKWGYLRLFWMVPLPLLFAAVGTTLVHQSGHSPQARLPRAITLLVILATLPLLGAHYVWSPSNIYGPPWKGTVMYATDNPYKMPSGLLAVAEELAGLPLGPEHRILCGTNEVTHLAPLVPAFDFVFARDFQTEPPLRQLGRMEELQRRMALGTDFLDGKLADLEAAPLLVQEKAAYVVLSPYTADLKERLPDLGYTLLLRREGFSLWSSRSVKAPIGKTSKASE
ncbi:MAG: DUF6077 domain-containing protein [Planctomycetota bacterium]